MTNSTELSGSGMPLFISQTMSTSGPPIRSMPKMPMLMLAASQINFHVGRSSRMSNTVILQCMAKFLTRNCCCLKLSKVSEKKNAATYEVGERRTVPVNYPLTAPIMTPLTKYFCTNGYKIRMGTDATMIVAYLIVSPI